ncbi:MAG: hypothetical protein ACOXZ5_06485 [Syntrophomonadaceae bacterium]
MATDAHSILKILIIATLIYYLIKSLLYIALWHATLKIEEKALKAQQKRRERTALRRQQYQIKR